MGNPTLRLAVDDHGGPEIFHSIQGEGPSIGAPRAFIRLSGCNLHCRWCDTAYTWNWSGTPFEHENDQKFDRAEQTVSLTATDIANQVSEFEPVGVVITGGEPLQQKAHLPDLIDALKSACGPLWVEIETNGSIAPTKDLISRINQFNVSPKLTHSGNDMSVALRTDVLEQYRGLPSAFFKFVIDAPSTLEEVRALARTHKIAPDRIFLMPLGTTSAEIRERSIWLTDECLKHSYRFTDRLHIHLYGDTRGT